MRIEAASRAPPESEEDVDRLIARFTPAFRGALRLALRPAARDGGARRRRRWCGPMAAAFRTATSCPRRGARVARARQPRSSAAAARTAASSMSELERINGRRALARGAGGTPSSRRARGRQVVAGRVRLGRVGRARRGLGRRRRHAPAAARSDAAEGAEGDRPARAAPALRGVARLTVTTAPAASGSRRHRSAIGAGPAHLQGRGCPAEGACDR